jgi:pyruvyltransferase
VAKGRGELAVWAWTRPKAGNFGDELGPEILARLGYRVRRVALRDAELISCGSVLEVAAASARPGTSVWGSGLQQGKPCDVSRLEMRAARGRLTATKIGVPDLMLGDPGLLVPELWRRPSVRHRIGVVRHYTDTRSFPWADAVIDTTIEPGRVVGDVIAQIVSCASIASSSLHGLIVAAAWGIPTMRLSWDRVVGGDFKFADALTGLTRHAADELIGALP